MHIHVARKNSCMFERKLSYKHNFFHTTSLSPNNRSFNHDSIADAYVNMRPDKCNQIIFIGIWQPLRLDYTITQSRRTQSHKVVSLKVVNTKTNKRVFKSVSPCIYVWFKCITFKSHNSRRCRRRCRYCCWDTRELYRGCRLWRLARILFHRPPDNRNTSLQHWQHSQYQRSASFARHLYNSIIINSNQHVGLTRAPDTCAW